MWSMCSYITTFCILYGARIDIYTLRRGAQPACKVPSLKQSKILNAGIFKAALRKFQSVNVFQIRHTNYFSFFFSFFRIEWVLYQSKVVHEIEILPSTRCHLSTYLNGNKVGVSDKCERWLFISMDNNGQEMYRITLLLNTPSE